MQREPNKNKLLSSFDISFFCGEAAMALHSGLMISDGLEAIGKGMKDSKAQKMFEEMASGLNQGHQFSEVIKEAGVFPDYMIQMIQIGEQVGSLEQMMRSLEDYYQKDAELKKQIKSAVTYPVVTAVMMAIIIGILTAKVFPVFSQIFESLGSELSHTALTAMKLGNLFVGLICAALAVLVVLLLVLAVVSRMENGREKIMAFFNHFFFTRHLFEKISAARFANILAMLLSSGYHLESSLEMVSTILPDEKIRGKVEVCTNQLKEGASITDALTQTGMFEGIYGSLVALSARTGNLDTALKQVSDTYMEDVDRTIEKGISAVEPVMVGITALIIGSILLAVMLPLMGIVSSIG